MAGGSESGVLYLYTVFHGNLAFSKIPSSHYSTIIDRCYWPIVELFEEFDVPLGIEFPAQSLETVGSIDPVFVDSLRDRWSRGKIEFIGSGYVQAIGPLIPADVNALNLGLGHQVYERLLGARPKTGLVNEQSYSAGVLALMAASGFEAVVMDWQNPHRFGRVDRESRYRPTKLIGTGGATCTAVWSHSVAFQKFQRYAHGSLDEDAYVDWICAHKHESETRCFPLYTNDLEVFDYRPGDPVRRDGEVRRLRRLFERLRSTPGVELTTPAGAIERLGCHGEGAVIESAEQPIPTKKQQKYSVVRWAVCGRDNALINGACYSLHQTIRQLLGLTEVPDALVSTFERSLVRLWASDYRTNTTHEKASAFSAEFGDLAGQLNRALAAASPASDATTIHIYNPHEFAIRDTPIKVAIGPLPPGRFRKSLTLETNGDEAPCQVENVQRYRDQSIRGCDVVLRPEIQPAASLTLSIVDATSPHATDSEHVSVESGKDSLAISTPAVRMRLNRNRGGAIESLTFVELGDLPVVGTIPHGSFEDIRFAADFYSAHCVFMTASGRKATDLHPSRIEVVQSPGPRRFRTTLIVETPTEVGHVTKTYRVYSDQPRVDVEYELFLDKVALTSVRLAHVTALVGAFAPAELEFVTVNGGCEVERFRIDGRPVDHGAPVNLAVSAGQCVGATEGWISLADSSKAVTIIGDRSKIAAVPMVHHQSLSEGPFFRVAHSLLEQDDTAAHIWRGHYVAAFSIIGHRPGWDDVRRTANVTAVPPLVFPRRMENP